MEKKIDLTRDQKMSIQESELKALQEIQIAVSLGEADVETVEANRKEGLKIRALEAKGYVHVFARVKHLDASGKNFVHEDRIIKIHAREFNNRVKEGAFHPYDEVEVIHDPREKAPKTYSLKPEQLGSTGTVQEKIDKVSGKEQAAINKAKEENQRTAEILEERKKKLAEAEEDMKSDLEDVKKRQEQLRGIEKSFDEREARLNAMQEELDKKLKAMDQAAKAVAPPQNAQTADKGNAAPKQ